MGGRKLHALLSRNELPHFSVGTYQRSDTWRTRFQSTVGTVSSSAHLLSKFEESLKNAIFGLLLLPG